MMGCIITLIAILVDMGSIRSFDIRQVRDKGNISTFIETGTLYGDGVDYALQSGFDDIISIEINETLATRAKLKYQNNSKVRIIQGNSPDILKNILPNIKKPVLFWLDAHFPGCDANLASYMDELDKTKRAPLEAELRVIRERNERDVIICDDLWIYKDWKTSYGSFNDHCKAHGHLITREEICSDDTLKNRESIFSDTHRMSEVYIDQGFMVFKPLNLD